MSRNRVRDPCGRGCPSRGRSGCAVAVERYGLSRREAEVLDLLARGRDVPYVAEELVISKNTVRTHTKSIFAKTGVHSRQELIDLVESIEA